MAATRRHLTAICPPCVLFEPFEPHSGLAPKLLNGRAGETMTLNRFRSLVRDQRGATMVEYIVIVALILLVALQAWKSLGNNVNAKTQSAADALQ
jgi:Flp pilus assembly pilin Flp